MLSYLKGIIRTLTGYRSSEDQDHHPYEPPKQRVRRESEDFNVGGNKREPAMPLRQWNGGKAEKLESEG